MNDEGVGCSTPIFFFKVKRGGGGAPKGRKEQEH